MTSQAWHRFGLEVAGVLAHRDETASDLSVAQRDAAALDTIRRLASHMGHDER